MSLTDERTEAEPAGPKANAESEHSKLKVGIILAVVGAVVTALVSWAVGWLPTPEEDKPGTESTTGAEAEADPTTTTSTAPPNSAGPTTTAAGSVDSTGRWATCGKDRCVALTVVNTRVGGHDDGLYIRSGPDLEGEENLTGAVEGQTVYAVCVVHDGFRYDGVSGTWARTPYHFVLPDLPGGKIDNPKSKSMPGSSTYGWAYTPYLSPADLIAQLPLCNTREGGPT